MEAPTPNVSRPTQGVPANIPERKSSSLDGISQRVTRLTLSEARLPKVEAKEIPNVKKEMIGPPPEEWKKSEEFVKKLPPKLMVARQRQEPLAKLKNDIIDHLNNKISTFAAKKEKNLVLSADDRKEIGVLKKAIDNVRKEKEIENLKDPSKLQNVVENFSVAVDIQNNVFRKREAQ